MDISNAITNAEAIFEWIVGIAIALGVLGIIGLGLEHAFSYIKWGIKKIKP